MSEIKTYKDLIVWQKSVAFVNDIYALTKQFPSDERFGLTSQLQRASVSVSANISEGWGRDSTASYLQFLRIVRASLFQAETLLIIAFNQKYIGKENLDSIEAKSTEISKMLIALIPSVEKFQVTKVKSSNTLMPNG